MEHFGRPWRLPGLFAAGAVAAAATAMAAVVGLGSAPVLAITLGFIVGAIFGPRPRLRPGLKFTSSAPLRMAVVLLGAELPLGAVATQGARSLPGIVITVLGCLLVGQMAGGRLRIAPKLRTLVSVGTSICGASAIAAVTPVIRAEEIDVGYSVSTIFVFNLVAVLIFPLLGHGLGMSQRYFGAFAGTAVNDLSSVVAAASIYGGASLHTAVIVKLTRTLMIIPICAYFGHASGQGTEPSASASLSRRWLLRAKGLAASVPTFLLGFMSLAGLRGVGVIPADSAAVIAHLATWLITLALAAVGLSIDIPALARTGIRPVMLGAVLWATVSLLALVCQGAGLL